MDQSAIRRQARNLLDSRFVIYGVKFDLLDIERMMIAVELEHDLPGIASTRSALRALAYNEAHVEYLRDNDPMVLRQITAPLPEFEGVSVPEIVGVRVG